MGQALQEYQPGQSDENLMLFRRYSEAIPYPPILL